MKQPLPLASLRASRSARGLSLVELMIAMVLGLIVLLGVMGVISANRQNYLATEALSEIQENARTAFELMARDIRQSGETGCGNNVEIFLNPALPAGWWQPWDPVRGFDDATATTAVAFGAGAGNRIANTDALQLQGVDGPPLPIVNSVTVAAAPASTNITTLAGHALRRNDVVVICNNTSPDFANPQPLSGLFSTLSNEPGGGATLAVAGADENLIFSANDQISRYSATTWYVGANARPADGGRSLYRARLAQGSGAAAAVVIEEVLPGVQNMQLRFRGTNAGGQLFAPAAAGTAWANVNAVEIVLTLVSTERNVASDATINADRRLQRTFTSIVALRNRAL